MDETTAALADAMPVRELATLTLCYSSHSPLAPGCWGQPGPFGTEMHVFCPWVPWGFAIAALSRLMRIDASGRGDDAGEDGPPARCC